MFLKHFVILYQVGVTYNVDKPPTDKSFNLIVRVIEADNRTVKTRSCMTYAGDGQKSGMAILEFGLPSGFNIDQDDVNKVTLRRIRGLERCNKASVGTVKLRDVTK